MEEEKKAKVISMFAEMKRTDSRKGNRRSARKVVQIEGGGTRIINSTIVVCGDAFTVEAVAKLLCEKRRSRKAV